MSNLKQIVFDFGGVLINWNPELLYQNIFTDRQEMAYFIKHICSAAWNAKQDAGRSFGQAINELVSIYPNYSYEIRAYYDRWEEMVSGYLEGAEQTLQWLNNIEIPLYGLTNWSNETLPIIYRNYGLDQYFKGIVVSGEEGLCKPDPKIYLVLTHRYNINPNETLFIDDNKANIQVANDLGFQVIHFKSHRLLKKVLGS